MPFTTLDLSKQSGTSLPSSIVTASGLSTGKIGQVVHAEMDVDTNIATSSFTDLTGGSETLELNITPSATSSKVWIIYTIQAQMISNRGFKSRIIRTVGGSDTTILEQPNEKDTYGDGNIHQQRSSIHYLDSPSTTSQITYTIQVATDGAQNTNFAKDNSDCMITAMEVLA